jgi:hypothetical protein
MAQERATWLKHTWLKNCVVEIGTGKRIGG